MPVKSYSCGRKYENSEVVESSAITLRDEAEMFRVAFEHSTVGMALVFPSGSWHRVNESLCKMLGYSEEELLSKTFQEIVHPEDRVAAIERVANLVRHKVPIIQHETRCLHKDGQVVWALWSVSPVFVQSSGTIQLIFQIQNTTDQKEAEKRLAHDAFHDALTGLPNRALVRHHLKLAISRVKRKKDLKFAVLFLDVDRFKLVNDTLGTHCRRSVTGWHRAQTGGVFAPIGHDSARGR